jgi:hypothetical protein
MVTVGRACRLPINTGKGVLIRLACFGRALLSSNNYCPRTTTVADWKREIVSSRAHNCDHPQAVPGRHAWHKR